MRKTVICPNKWQKITKLKNDTGVSFAEADLISGDGNGTGTDYATWGAGWTVE